MNFEQLLKFGVDQGASAVHLQAESSPQLRIGGKIRNVEGSPLKADELRVFLESIAPKRALADLEKCPAIGSVFATTIGSAGRFRGTVYRFAGGLGLVLKVIPPTIRTVEELNLPPAVKQVAAASRGLILVVGPASSGKTTTLAALVDLVNASTYQKITTVESPVEYLFTNKKSLITQTEVRLHSASFDQGLELALLQDVDVGVLGDLCDAATARRALAAAESGKKVMAAMMGLDAIQALGRLIGMIGPVDRETAVAQLAAALEGVIALRLANTKDGKILPAVEILRGGVNTTRSVLENRLKDLSFLMEGRQGGMQTLDQHLIELYQAGAISGTETMRLASNPENVAVELRTKSQASARTRHDPEGDLV